MSRKSTFVLSALLALSACKSGNQETANTAAPAADQAASAPAAANPVDPATAATINGVIKFTGAKPKIDKIKMNADAFCQSHHTETVYADDVVLNPNNTLKWVYVYVKTGLEGKTFPAPAAPAVLDQQGCVYTPHVLAVQTGQEVTIRNSDGVLHNVNARAKENPGFNIGQPVKGMESKKTFNKPEVMIPVKCDVHPWMHSWIGVQSHPYAAVSDDTGAFSLSNLPPGDYEIEAWHEKYGTSSQKVTVGAQETKSIEFTFKGA